MKAHWISCLLLSSCVVEPPSGPPAVLITVSGAGSPAAAGAMDDARVALLDADGSRSAWELLAGLLTAQEPPPPQEGWLRLPGAATTLVEAIGSTGIETAIFAAGGASTSESGGLLQGALHVLDGPLLEALGGEDPARFAIGEAESFLLSKLPRPMEDAPFVWLHLELGALEPERARAAVDEAWGRMGAALDGRPESLRVLVVLPTPGFPGAALFAGGRVEPSRSSLPLSLFDVAPTLCGLMDSARPIEGLGADRSAELEARP